MRKLLSITIPTFNRAATLDIALSIILPQVEKLKNEIEFIISDNASTDNTSEVIHKWISKYPQIEFIVNVQETNTGFFGNFKKCKELATGKFIWILSDDDFVKKGLIEKIVELISSGNDELGIIFINNHPESPQTDSGLKHEVSIEKLFLKFNYELTLVSSVIFINKKENDRELFEELNSSNLIGFAMVCEVIKYRSKACWIQGYFMDYRMEEVSEYNIFDAFIIDLNKILVRMSKFKYGNKIVRKIRSRVLRYILIKRYFYFRAKNKLDGKLQYYSLDKMNKLLREYFSNTISYWVILFPLTLVPSFFFRITFPLVNYTRNILRA